MAKLRSINPATGKLLGEVKISTKLEVEEAVQTAKTGFEKWRKLSLVKRGKILLNLADLLTAKANKLAEMISLEMGKPLVEAKDEVEGAAEGIREQVKEGLMVLRDEVLAPKLTKKQQQQMERQAVENAVQYLVKQKAKVISVLRYDPIGVVAVIMPWNFPIDTPLLGIVPALLAGNTVVFKPSEEVPLVSQELAKLFWQAGVPRDVLLLLQGRKQVGSMLVDTAVEMVFFTGSTEVGQEIAKKCASRLTKYTLEMGGSSPALVLKDANLELAANAIVWGRFTNCGQVCSALKRVLVEEPVANQLIEKLVAKTKELRVGNPMNKGVDLGPLVSEKQLKRLMGQVTKGVIQGGRILVGGRRLYDEPYNKGWFHEPTVMVHVQPKMDIMQEEVFGPVLAVCVVEDLDQAIEYANQSRYGLTAAVFTASKSKAEQVQTRVRAGSVYVNEAMAFSAGSPWCGLKQSGFGVAGSKHGIWEFVHKRHVYADWTGAVNRQQWFPYA